MKSIVVNEDVIESQRRIRKHRDRIERFERAGFDTTGLLSELRLLEEVLAKGMLQREALARWVA